VGENADDPPRLLARASERGYVSVPQLAMTHEPEAVPAAYQRRLSSEAARRAAQQEQAAWADGRRLIVDGLTVVRAAKPSKPVQNALRVVDRVVAKLDRTIGGR
jgi:hypothetical protein